MASSSRRSSSWSSPGVGCAPIQTPASPPATPGAAQPVDHGRVALDASLVPGKMGGMALDEGTATRLRSALARVDLDAIYYALTLTATDDGHIRWASQTIYVGPGAKPYWELRVSAPVNALSMRRAWGDVGQTSIVVADLGTLSFFLRAGGNAHVEESIARGRFPRLFEPVECAPSWWGVRSMADVQPKALRHAPTPKLRMDVLRRDDYRCRACGRRSADYVGLELHVHHIWPHGKGG